MGNWQFVLEETDIKGKPNHATHHGRRKKAWRRASWYFPPITKVTDNDGEGDVGEGMSGGRWRYTMTVFDPTDFNVYGFVGLITGFGFVTCVSGPSPQFTLEEAGKLDAQNIEIIKKGEPEVE